MMQAIYRTVRTIILIILVGASMVLSYFLWSGNLQKGDEISFTQGPAMPISTTPVLSDTITPYQVIVRMAKQYAVVRPNTSLYTSWISMLQGVRASHSRIIGAIPQDATTQITYDFGIEINNELGRNWLGSMSQALTGWQCRAIVLYIESNSSVCHIAFVGENDTGANSVLSASTTIDLSKLTHMATTTVEKAPVSAWTDFMDASYVPIDGKMRRLTYSTSTPDLLPLVHTFFVNPQAITRIQESVHTNLWTDGSRAVQVDSQRGSLDYEDPNASSQSLHTQDYITAINFLHAHGGGPTNLIGFDSYSTLTDDMNAPSIVFTQFVDGYPILNNVANYSLSIDNGRVLQYDRPVWSLSTLVQQKSVNIIGEKQLTKSMKQMDHTANLSTFHVELGYQPVSLKGKANGKGNRLRLEPVYYVTSSSGEAWVVDAVTGSLLSGEETS